MTIQLDPTNLLALFAVVMLTLWGMNFVIGMWRERQRRRSRIPTTVKRPAGYSGATPIDYTEHPDAAVDRMREVL
jgi:hypothetical protein